MINRTEVTLETLIITVRQILPITVILMSIVAIMGNGR